MEVFAIVIFVVGAYALFASVTGSNFVPDSVEEIMDSAIGFSAAIQAFAQAIASAEGFSVLGSVPYRCHNPGDLSKVDIGDTGSYMVAGGTEYIIVFPDDSTGWTALYTKLQRIVNGTSKVYSLGMSIRQMGLTYSGGDPNWPVNVAAFLGVNQDTLLSEVLQ